MARCEYIRLGECHICGKGFTYQLVPGVEQITCKECSIEITKKNRERLKELQEEKE